MCIQLRKGSPNGAVYWQTKYGLSARCGEKFVMTYFQFDCECLWNNTEKFVLDHAASVESIIKKENYWRKVGCQHLFTFFESDARTLRE